MTTRTTPFHRLLLLGAATAALLPGSAAAQDTVAAAAAAPALEEPAASEPPGDVVVTARRREERAQDVPIALSVVGSEALDRTGNFTLGQVQQLVPSLQVFSFNPRNTNINIRGLGSDVALTNDGLENGVGIYIDNVFYGRVGQSQFDLVDLDRIDFCAGRRGRCSARTRPQARSTSPRAPLRLLGR